MLILHLVSKLHLAIKFNFKSIPFGQHLLVNDIHCRIPKTFLGCPKWTFEASCISTKFCEAKCIGNKGRSVVTEKHTDNRYCLCIFSYFHAFLLHCLMFFWWILEIFFRPARPAWRSPEGRGATIPSNIHQKI